MSEISNEKLLELKNKYLDNKIFTIGRNALNQNAISKIIYVSEEEKNTQKNFTIDLDSLPVLNQGASRRINNMIMKIYFKLIYL